MPEDGYKADYVNDLAAALPDDVWASATAARRRHRRACSGGGRPGGSARASRRASTGLGVRFDVWTSEARLHDEGWVERAVDRLRERGHVYEQDGAFWFRSTAFGDDKDRVILRSNGEPTYFAADIGYVTEKFSRGFDHLIYIWGADHHGTVARVRNAAEAMGYDRDAVEMLLYSWVRFVRDGEEVSMSKRAGEFITLDELLAEVGVDAARWFFASRAATTGIDFDIELAKKQSNENPVYYVQYAHARIASILRKAADTGLRPATEVVGALGGAPEAALARVVARFPEVVEDAVAAEETHGITAYATELATTFHAFYRDARVVDPDAPERSAARLALAEAARVTLANALGLLGISGARVDVAGARVAARPSRESQASDPGRSLAAVVAGRRATQRTLPPAPGRTARRRRRPFPARSWRPSRTPPRQRSCPRSSARRRPTRRSGPSTTARRSPPQPAAAADASAARRRSRAARRRSGTRRRCPAAGRSSRHRAASRGRPAASPRPAPRPRRTFPGGGSARWRSGILA